MDSFVEQEITLGNKRETIVLHSQEVKRALVEEEKRDSLKRTTSSRREEEDEVEDWFEEKFIEKQKQQDELAKRLSVAPPPLALPPGVYSEEAPLLSSIDTSVEVPSPAQDGHATHDGDRLIQELNAKMKTRKPLIEF